MRGYAKIAFVGLLMMGLLAVPNLSPATDGRHSLLNKELRSKIEHLRDKIEDNREHQHNQGGIPASLQALQARVASLETTLAAANTQLSVLTARLNALPTSGASTDPVLVELAKLAKYVKLDPNPINGLNGPHVIFHDANVHIQNGSGTTADLGKLKPGLGNLIVGYNEMPAMTDPMVDNPVPQGQERVGLHNLVVGPYHAFASAGGVVFGTSNLIYGPASTILGGSHNINESTESSILGSSGYKFNVMAMPQSTYP